MTDRTERSIQMQFLYVFIVSPFELLMLPVVICQENNQDTYTVVLHFCMFVNCLLCTMLVFQAKAKKGE